MSNYNNSNNKDFVGGLIGWSIILVGAASISIPYYITHKKNKQEKMAIISEKIQQNSNKILNDANYLAEHASDAPDSTYFLTKEDLLNSCWDKDSTINSISDSVIKIFDKKLSVIDSIDDRLSYIRLKEDIGDVNLRKVVNSGRLYDYNHDLDINYRKETIENSLYTYFDALSACVKPERSISMYYPESYSIGEGDTVSINKYIPELSEDRERLYWKIYGLKHELDNIYYIQHKERTTVSDVIKSIANSGKNRPEREKRSGSHLDGFRDALRRKIPN